MDYCTGDGGFDNCYMTDISIGVDLFFAHKKVYLISMNGIIFGS
jgi:hypothetical protein